jgi:drug/metabolite transporter superfamily protein YnfA
MLATLVNASADAVQILALIAAIAFGAAAILSMRPSKFIRGLFALGGVFVALSLMFLA